MAFGLQAEQGLAYRSTRHAKPFTDFVFREAVTCDQSKRLDIAFDLVVHGIRAGSIPSPGRHHARSRVSFHCVPIVPMRASLCAVQPTMAPCARIMSRVADLNLEK